MSAAAEWLGTPGQKALISARGEFYAVFSEVRGLTMCLTPLTDELLHQVTISGTLTWPAIQDWALERKGDQGIHLWAVALKETPQVALGRMIWTYKGTNLITEDPGVLTEEQDATIPHLMGMASELWPEVWTSPTEPDRPRVMFSSFGPATPPAEA